MDDFERELKQGFLEEATQLIVDIEQCFLDLETSPGDQQILEKIFRAAHNLKGSSKAVGFEEMGAFAHRFESFLLKVKNGEIAGTPPTISLLLKCADHIKAMIEGLKADLAALFDSTALLGEIDAYMANPAAAQAGASPSPAPETGSEAISPDEIAALEGAPAPIDSPEATAAAVEAAVEAAAVEAPTEAAMAPPPVLPADANAAHELMAQLTQDQMASAQPSSAAPVAPVTAAVSPQEAKPEVKQDTKPAPTKTPVVAVADESIRVSIGRLEKLLNFVGEMVILETVLREQVYGSNPMLLRRTVHQLGKVTKEVQDISMSLRMVPVKQTFQKMQRIVRDTSSALGKKINFTMSGEETELDKTVLENISDPLVHLVRNAADHGIEDADRRKAAGKPETGSVSLSAFQRGGRLVIEVKDDGGGIDGEKLRLKAIEKGILKPGTVLSPKDSIFLVFAPGFSTKAVVTDVSGRGVGMDVVKTNIEKLQGEVQIETIIGKGTTFRIVLPLTLAIIDGLVVNLGNERFVVPLNHVHETVKVEAAALQFNTGLGEVLMLRGENIPVTRLGALLGKKQVGSEAIALIIRTLGAPFCILVDDIVGQHQVVIKKLGKELAHLKGFGGSAILGDGRPALILELGDLAQSHSHRINKSEPPRRVAA